MATKKKRWTKEQLFGLGIPAVLIPGILLAITLGWNPKELKNVTDYHNIKTLFPEAGIVAHISDGDTFELQNGVAIRTIGINAPDKGQEKYQDAKNYLTGLIKGKRVYLEYDRYQDDKYGRVIAWVWVECEQKPTFLPAEYMHLSRNASREGLMENPEGCKTGVLVNEMLVDDGFAKVDPIAGWAELKYEKRLMEQ